MNENIFIAYALVGVSTAQLARAVGVYACGPELNLGSFSTIPMAERLRTFPVFSGFAAFLNLISKIFFMSQQFHAITFLNHSFISNSYNP